MLIDKCVCMIKSIKENPFIVLKSLENVVIRNIWKYLHLIRQLCNFLELISLIKLFCWLIYLLGAVWRLERPLNPSWFLPNTTALSSGGFTGNFPTYFSCFSYFLSKITTRLPSHQEASQVIGQISNFCLQFVHSNKGSRQSKANTFWLLLILTLKDLCRSWKFSWNVCYCFHLIFSKDNSTFNLKLNFLYDFIPILSMSTVKIYICCRNR